MQDLTYQNKDITLSGVSLSVTNKELLLQRLQTKFKWFAEEYVYDETYGVPYFQDILGKKQVDIYEIFEIFTQKLTEEKEVTNAEVTDFNFDANTRKMTITFAIESTFGNIGLEVGA